MVLYTGTLEKQNSDEGHMTLDHGILLEDDAHFSCEDELNPSKFQNVAGSDSDSQGSQLFNY